MLIFIRALCIYWLGSSSAVPRADIRSTMHWNGGPMKILLVATLMDVGGAEIALLRLARGLKDRGHDVMVLTLFDRASVIPVFQHNFGLQIYDLQMKYSRPKRLLHSLFYLARGLYRMNGWMRQGYDVVQTFGPYGNVIGQVMGALSGIPVRVSSQRYRLDILYFPMPTLDRWIANS